MPAFTPHLNLYLPGGGSLGIGGDDEVADIDKVNQDFQKIDTWAEEVDEKIGDENFSKPFYGPALGRVSVSGMKVGDTYQESDGDRKSWFYDGTNWVIQAFGTYLIRPTSVTGTGVTISPTGEILLSNTSSEAFINGVFTSKFKKYKIVIDATFPTASGGVMNLLKAGVQDTGAAYSQQHLGGFAATATASSLLSGTFWSLWGINAFDVLSEITIIDPASSNFTRTKVDYSIVNSSYGVGQFAAIHGVLESFDGFRIATAGGNFTSGTVSVYGLV